MDQLRGLHRADVAVIGGGLTGLLLGAALAQDGVNIAILDAQSAPGGPGAAIAALPAGTMFRRAAEAHGLHALQAYAAALQTHLNALLASSLPYVQPAPAYTYARAAADLPALENRRSVLTRLGLPAHTASDAGGCPFPVELSLLSQGAVADLHRWKAALISSIRRSGGRVYFSSRVVGFDGPRICTAAGALHAPLIVLATGKPLGLRDARLLSLLESRTLAHCAMLPDIPLYSIQQPVGAGLSLCPSPLATLATMDIGRCGTRQQSRNLHLFTEQLAQLLPDWRQGEMCFSHPVMCVDGLPVIGAMPGSRMLFASGYGDYGVLGAMHAADVLHRRLMGRALPEDALYSPDRKLPPRLLQREQRRIAGLRAAGLFRQHAPVCSHCDSRMRYFIPDSRWECPCCGSACTLLGQPVDGPGLVPVQVSPRQRPLE